MGPTEKNRIQRVLRHARFDVPAHEVTTFGVGGKIAVLLDVSDAFSLRAALTEAKRLHIPHTVIAGGSNIIFQDGVYEKLVIRICGGEIEALTAERMRVEAGASLDDFIRKAISRGLAGVETLSGIPGSVGGAVVGNAGAYGRTVSDSLQEVRIYDGARERTLKKEECAFAYRESIFKQRAWVVLDATFQLARADRDRLEEVSREIVNLRLRKYRPGLRCPGSFFKNIVADDVDPEARARIPEQKIIEGKIPAGFLLESVGARGRVHGGLSVAHHHGNLIVNEGRATCGDVADLARHLKRDVYDKFGIRLEEEVRYMK